MTATTPPAGARDAVTDEMVERACVAFYEDPATFLSLRPQPAAQISMRRDMRAALEAALAAQPAPVVGDRIVLLSRGVEPNWWFIAERSKRPDVNGLPIYETLDPITRATRPAESVAQGGDELPDDATNLEVIEFFIRVGRTMKPVGHWPGERLYAAIERVLNTPRQFIAEADMVERRGHNGRGGDEKQTLRPFAPTPATGSGGEVSELRLVAKRNLRSMIECGSDDKKLMLTCLEELS